MPWAPEGLYVRSKFGRPARGEPPGTRITELPSSARSPGRVAKVEITPIRQRAGRGASRTTDRGARARAAESTPDDRAAGRTNAAPRQGALGRAVTAAHHQRASQAEDAQGLDIHCSASTTDVFHPGTNA